VLFALHRIIEIIFKVKAKDAQSDAVHECDATMSLWKTDDR